MTDRSPGGDGELSAHERRLALEARRRVAGVGDAELSRILRTVSARRAARVSRSRRGPEPAPRDAAPGTITSIVRVGPDVRIFRFTRPPGLSFTAGQYLKVGVEGHKRRSFSLASAPHDDHLELCIELVPNGRLTPVLFGLREGDTLDVADRAKGSFTLDGGVRTHLMVATVTGIAPLRSMLRDALHRGRGGEFVVLHGASHVDELPYRDELEALARTNGSVRYVATVSRPGSPRNAGWSGCTGRVDPLAFEVASDLEPSTTRVYACGNGAMVANVAGHLGGAGFAVATETFD